MITNTTAIFEAREGLKIAKWAEDIRESIWGQNKTDVDQQRCFCVVFALFFVLVVFTKSSRDHKIPNPKSQKGNLLWRNVTELLAFGHKKRRHETPGHVLRSRPWSYPI